jgi:hypothetical protein
MRTFYKGVVIGAATSALVLAAAAAIAATGGNFILGQPNTASSTSGLSANLPSTPALDLANLGGGPAASFRTGTAIAPFTVNSNVKVAKLNADMVDGKHASAFLPAMGKAADSDKLDGIDSTGFLRPGDPAGGDLAGSYPNPTIAPGAVTPAKLGAIPAVRVWNDADQPAYTGGATQVVSFDAESFDTANMHDNATNNTRLTAPLTGIYAITASVCFTPNGTGQRLLAINKNSAELLDATQLGAIAAPYYTCVPVDTTAKLSAGDYVELWEGAPNTTGAINVVSTSDLPAFTMTWVAPG